MADEKFDVGKLIRGFNITKGEVIGKIVFIVIIACVVCGVFYVLFFRPTHRTTQNAQQIITNVTDESAVELQLIPPKVKVGGVKLKMFK